MASFKPGKFGEVQKLYEKAVETYQDGFKGAYLLQQPGSDDGLSVIFWDSLEDMEANQLITRTVLPLKFDKSISFPWGVFAFKS